MLHLGIEAGQSVSFDLFFFFAHKTLLNPVIIEIVAKLSFFKTFKHIVMICITKLVSQQIPPLLKLWEKLVFGIVLSDLMV